MRMKLYNFLVNRHIGIQKRYHRFHDRAHGLKKALSWVYLLWLNLCYYMFFCRFLGKDKKESIEDKKKLPIDASESSTFKKEFTKTPQWYIEQLKNYEYISFDIFDTLIFRPFSEPTDVFYLLGEKLSFMDFKRIRMEAEWKARVNAHKENGHYEVNLDDIWSVLTKETGIDKETGMKAELELETKLCYANPFMKQVFDELVAMGKHVMIISDMYIPAKEMQKILDKNGITGYKKLYVSCEYGKNKAGGELYSFVKEELKLSGDVSKKWAHIGDNYNSDINNANKNGLSTYHYPNVNEKTKMYRPYDMSLIVGGAYRGIVNEHLYNGLYEYSMEYEYGYVYGGLFVLGYCNFIHDYYIKNDIDKLFFLSRDGDILKQAYDYLYPNDVTEYVYWSRRAATKLMANHNKYDYFRRFIHHKASGQYTVLEILKSMELDNIINMLSGDTAARNHSDKVTIDNDVLNLSDKVTSANVPKLQKLLEDNWDKVLEAYETEKKGAIAYFNKLVENCKKVCAIDIGWAGSGALSMSYLLEKAWKYDLSLTGIIAGTNTIYNFEADASESFLQSGKLVAYLYSQSHNRDLIKMHDPNKNYNVFWELLLSSPTKQFKGFGYDEATKQVELYFGKEDYNTEGMLEIQNGIMDFVKDYKRHFEDIPYMYNVSGRDAYAPMIAAASYDEKYLKVIEKKFALEINVS